MAKKKAPTAPAPTAERVDRALAAGDFAAALALAR